jgi:hypothetical protein
LPDDDPSPAPRPWGLARLPSSLVAQLHSWHAWLGIPTATITAAMDAKGRPSGTWTMTSTPLQVRTLEVSAAVREAYATYNAALLEILARGDAPSDFDACYGRFHDKALRIAMLLASLSYQDTISMTHWAYAQQVTERWRLMLHQIVQLVSASQPLTREEQLEHKIEQQISHNGPRTARELRQCIRGYGSSEIQHALHGMTTTERLVPVKDGRAQRYALPGTVPPENEPEEEQNEVPF